MRFRLLTSCAMLLALAGGQAVAQTNSYYSELAALGLQDEAPAAPMDDQAMATNMSPSDCGCAVADSCPSCCNCYLFGDGEPWELMSGDNCHGIKIGGWVDAGYTSHTVPLSTTFGDGLSFQDVPHQLSVNQTWLYLDKALVTDDCSWNWGYHFDFLYGTDAQKTQAFGGTGWDNDWDHGVYGWALPQAYLELGRGDLSIKLGHFYTLAGYEVVQATGNFFYSHTLTHFNSEPFTHTGVVATYKWNDDVTFYGGWTAGWDTGFESFNDGSNFIGGVSLTLTDNVNLVYVTTIGDFGWRGDDGRSHSLCVYFKMTDKLNYDIHCDILDVDSTGEYDDAIVQYLTYKVNDCFALGARFEYWDDGTEHNATTLGLNYKPHANVTLRPEVRFDGGDSAAENETSFGIDAVVQF